MCLENGEVNNQGGNATVNRTERRKALKQLGSDTREFFKFLVKECVESGTDSFSFEWDNNIYTIDEIDKVRKMLKI